MFYSLKMARLGLSDINLMLGFLSPNIFEERCNSSENRFTRGRSRFPRNCAPVRLALHCTAFRTKEQNSQIPITGDQELRSAMISKDLSRFSGSKMSETIMSSSALVRSIMPCIPFRTVSGLPTTLQASICDA